MKLIDVAYKHALIVLEHCVRPVGFYASGLPGGYEALWARDSMTTCLGASLVGNPFDKAQGKRFKAAFRQSLITLSKNQSWLGQIPNAVGCYNPDRRSRVTFNSIDSTLWYLVGHQVYAKAYRNKSLLKKFRTNIEKALLWLSYQDPNEDTLPVQQPTMDWQDIFPHKYGRTINTQALYYGVLTLFGKRKLAENIKQVVNGEIKQYLSLYDKKRGYYLPWLWKNHDGHREQEEWFDTLGNLLAIVTNLATPRIAKSILHFIEKAKVNRPYPCKTIWPPIKKGDKEWHSYFVASEAKRPYHYLNAGIWPFLGGFYIAALVKTKQFAKAKQELELLAQANKLGRKMQWGFQEWLHGKTGKPTGGSSSYQAWSAGMYVFAYECVRNKKVPYFS